MVGAVLAGGAGKRLGGGSKPAATLAGRPLAAYPSAALAAVCERVALVCKPDTEVPELDGVERWEEPVERRHPLIGIVHALERAGGPVLVCAADMPFVTAHACQTLLQAAGGSGGPAVVAVADGVLQPVFALYGPAALGPFGEAPGDAALTPTVEALDPVRVAMPASLLRSVNTPDELAWAEREMAG